MKEITIMLASLMTFLKNSRNKFGCPCNEGSEISRTRNLDSLIYFHSHDCIVIADERGVILSVNPAFERLSGYDSSELVNVRPNKIDSYIQNGEFYKALKNAIDLKQSWEGEITYTDKEGKELYYKLLTIQRIIEEDGNSKYIAVLSDMSKMEEANQKIWYETNFDALTDLPNRHMFLHHLEQQLSKSGRDDFRRMGLMYIDLDDFKEINDMFGHQIGDTLLKQVTTRIISCLRNTDLCFRIGGDEFTVILPDIENLYVVETIAQNILKELSSPFELENSKNVFISASIGIAIAPDDASDSETILKYADQAMYQSKKSGKNASNFFTQSMQDALIKRFQLIKDMHIACAKEQFVLYYQPIFEIKTGQIHKAEALIRWKHPDGHLINPADFISIAEETGMILEIGEWIVHEAIKTVSQWRRMYNEHFQISVNISPIQFHQKNGGIPEWIKVLTSDAFANDSVVVEITESVMLEDSAIVWERLKLLEDAKIEISLDDFGTGYSSLSYLKNHPYQYLKIDQSFVKQLEINLSDQILCKMIIDIAHQLNMKVIAEGVETQYHRDILQEMKCDYLQGYAISKPLPADEFVKRFFNSEE